MYGAVVVRPVVNLAKFMWRIVDVLLIDGFINGLAQISRDVADSLRHSQSGKIRNYAVLFAGGVVLAIAYFALGLE